MTFKAHYCKMSKTKGSNPMFGSKLHITSGGSMAMPSAYSPSQQSKIFSNSCSFSENLANNTLVAPRKLVPPPIGNPGSAPDYIKYLDQFLMVLLTNFTSICKNGRFLFEYLATFAGNLHLTRLVFVRQLKEGPTTLCFK